MLHKVYATVVLHKLEEEIEEKNVLRDIQAGNNLGKEEASGYFVHIELCGRETTDSRKRKNAPFTNIKQDMIWWKERG